MHRELEKEIYMDILPSFDRRVWPNKIYKLNEALYELKQSPTTCFDRLTRVIINMEFKYAQGDHTFFIKYSKIRGVITLLVYVDDIILIENNEKK